MNEGPGSGKTQYNRVGKGVGSAPRRDDVCVFASIALLVLHFLIHRTTPDDLAISIVVAARP
jgi:hypothetical protein